MSEYGCKVCRILDEYGMERYEEQLLEQWQADASQRKGYRQLAEWFNTLMLRREMDRAGLSTLGDEAESKYERLQSDEAVAAEVATELENAGIPINTLRDDFVSYGVIRTHLKKKCLESDVDLSSGDWERNAIEISQDHATTKIEEAVSGVVGRRASRRRNDRRVRRLSGRAPPRRPVAPAPVGHSGVGSHPARSTRRRRRLSRQKGPAGRSRPFPGFDAADCRTPSRASSR